MSDIIIPTEIPNCCDVKCEIIEHKIDIDDYVEKVLQAVNNAAHECLPVPKSYASSCNKKTIAGWNLDVKPYKEMSQFWAAIWKSAGRPLNNGLHQIMKKCRNLYHYQVKKVMKAQDSIKK